MKTFFFIFSFYLLLVNNICFSQKAISFEKEDITFEIQDSLFIVKGIYYLTTDNSKEVLFIYPFPTDSIYGIPFDINIYELNTNKVFKYNASEDFSYISFIVQLSEDTPLLITYKQPIKSKKARYILLTTKSWNKPLKIADYKLITDKELKISNFSYFPDRKTVIDNKNVFIWHFENFMPNKDFEIVFED